MSLIQYSLAIGISFGILLLTGRRIMYLLKVNVSGEFVEYEQSNILKIYATIFNKGFCSTNISNITVQIKNKKEILNYQIAGAKYEEDGITKIFLKDYINCFKIKKALKLDFGHL